MKKLLIEYGNPKLQYKLNPFIEISTIYYLSSEKVDDLEAVLDDPDCHQLLSVVSSVHHQRVDQSLHDRALGLAEALGGVTAGAVRQKLGELLLDGDVILKTKRNKLFKTSSNSYWKQCTYKTLLQLAVMFIVTIIRILVVM